MIGFRPRLLGDASKRWIGDSISRDHNDVVDNEAKMRLVTNAILRRSGGDGGGVFAIERFAGIGIELGVAGKSRALLLRREGRAGGRRLIARFLNLVLDSLQALLEFDDPFAEAAADFRQAFAKDQQAKRCDDE